MYSVPVCLVCGERDSTPVAEFNTLILLDEMWQSDMARSNYKLCHGCGLVYASRRPERAEYEYLYENFNEFTVRKSRPDQNIFNESGPLTAELRAEIDAAYVPWWELRAAAGQGGRVIGPMLSEFERALGDLPELLLHCTLKDASVLQIRTKTANFADLFRRLCSVQKVDLITLFAVHQYMAEKAGYRAASCLDYQNFEIPFAEKYDLILENHLFIHTLDAKRMFATLREHLKDGGHLFLRQELDDTRLFKKRANLFSQLLPFHFQLFDIPTLDRMLQRFGFAVKNLRCKQGSEIIGVAQMQAEAEGAAPRISPAELIERQQMYTQWRDESILSLPPERAKELYGSELARAAGRVAARGGMPKPRKARLSDLAPVQQESVAAS